MFCFDTLFDASVTMYSSSSRNNKELKLSDSN